MSSFSLRLLIY